ncbi:MAG: phosphatase PAP2 family protein [Prevotellaceae bacterium]|nr:phosphatase PAP2 family protein [Prevotellaceae bacterium]
MESAFWRGYSTVITKSAATTAIALPTVIGAIALIQKDDILLKDAACITAAFTVNAVLTYSLKYSINRKRPYEEYPFLDVPYPERSPSYPSGHTSLAFTAATALTLKYPKWYIIIPAYFWAGSVAFSRMNLGVHYPSDVLSGALLGVGSAFAAYKINAWFWQKRSHRQAFPESTAYYWY